jgi:O-antigen ligase
MRAKYADSPRNRIDFFYRLIKYGLLILVLILVIPRNNAFAEPVLGVTIASVNLSLTASALAAILFAIWTLRKQNLQLLWRTRLLMLLLMLCFTSTLWSSDPMGTVRQSFHLLVYTLLGIHVAANYTFRQQIQLWAVVLALVLVISTLFVIFLPQYGLDHSTNRGAWQGFVLHKNLYGPLVAEGIIVAILNLLSRPKLPHAYWLMLGLAAISILFVRSASALLALGVVMVLAVIATALRKNYSIIIGVLSGVLAVALLSAVLVLPAAGRLLAVINRDDTLTGRILIWEETAKLVIQRPWLGYGVAAFWRGWDGPSSVVWVNYGNDWRPPHGHNGYLDLWGAVGFAGLGLFLLWFSFTYGRSVLRVRHTTTADGYWSLLFLTYFMVNNLTESILLDGKLHWIILVATAVSLLINETPRQIASPYHQSIQSNYPL